MAICVVMATTMKQKRRRSRHRPSSNSYLKVILDEEIFDVLYQLSLHIKTKIQERNGAEPNGDGEFYQGVAKVPNVDSESRSYSVENTRPLSYQPRSRESLHMTLFFGGKIFCALPEDELRRWHLRVKQRLEVSGFRLSDSENNASDFKRASLDFTIKDLRVFPPQRCSLVVAVFVVQPEWDSIYRDLRAIASDESCSPILARFLEDDEKDKLIAHVTIGNLRGGRKSERKSLDGSVLQPLLNDAISSRKTQLVARTQGIAMGGPIPNQAELEWNFALQRSDSYD